MRLPLALLLVLAVASPAAAQAERKRVRGARIPPFAGAPAAAPAAPVNAAPPGRLALTGLPAIADPRAACRATCARQRYQCEAGDEGCSPAWSRCTATCQAGPRR